MSGVMEAGMDEGKSSGLERGEASPAAGRLAGLAGEQVERATAEQAQHHPWSWS